MPDDPTTFDAASAEIEEAWMDKIAITVVLTVPASEIGVEVNNGTIGAFVRRILARGGQSYADAVEVTGWTGPADAT